MNSRKSTLQERVAKAQQRMANWDPQLAAAMQLQGAMPRGQLITLGDPPSPADNLRSSLSVPHRGRVPSR